MEKADGPTSTPAAPGLSAKTATSITLDQNVLHQFKKDAGDWQDSNVFTGLTASTEYTFTARVKGTTTHYASTASLGTAITTLNTDATLSDLTVDGATITGFDPATLSYSKVLIYETTTVPEVLATLTDADASMVITQAINVNGTEEERTATILVTAEDGTTTKTYEVIFGSISITITKTGPTTANQGDDITYTITYKNEGTFSATNVVITETYPAEVEYVSANPEPDSGFDNKWTIGTLALNGEGTIIITVHIK